MIEHSGAADRPVSLIPRGSLLTLWRTDATHGLGIPGSDDRAAWDAVADPVRSALLAQADADRGEPWPELLLTDWSAYRTRGSRLAYEDPFFARSERTRRAVLAAALDPSDERLAEAANGLWLLCEQSSWCWPAHDDAFGRGLLTTDVARPFLDLGAGEAAAQAAWADIVIGSRLEAAFPGVRARLRHEATRRTLEPLLAERWHWEGTEERMHNWAPWIYGNLFVAAHAFADGELRDAVSERCIDGIDRYLAQLPSDGAIDEGFAYWWQGAARALDALHLVDAVTGGAVNRETAPGGSLAGLAELVRFPERVHLGGDWYASWSDAEARAAEPLPWSSLRRAARLCHVPSTAAFAAAHEDPVAMATASSDTQSGLGRQVLALLDADAHRDGGDPLPARVELTSIGIGIARSREGSAEGLAVVVKAGHNDEAHNHNDLGAIEIAVDGVPVVIDPGRETYTAQTFSDERYGLWYVSSDWHSTPLPRGLTQRPGADSRSTATAGPAAWTIDLSRAYPLASEERWRRQVELDGETVRIHDSWSLAEGAGAVVLVCAGTPRVDGDDLILPSVDGGRGLRIAHDAAACRIEHRDIADPIMARSWGDRLSRIVLEAAPGSSSLDVRARVEAS
ncbi:heparinase II/III domain-containing protein [Microbacterium suaedae]|uniref:heparinase II/III domain-containing protein n=1 Tax=Microbacterium suaedae TaxID=2067813 RepID=UPI000DA25763|nr:heparinase II/III family protein [Microbacterium suaedae]